MAIFDHFGCCVFNSDILYVGALSVEIYIVDIASSRHVRPLELEDISEVDTYEISGKVDIEDDGSVFISASNPASSNQALEIIKGIVFEPEVGAIYRAKVVKL